ncbi:hypothetical protein BVRB_3g055990 [Beta vulgaris subsp. vulgaris]|uniref:Uncharacterized protein n=1 Tax=Beta vulgaris subsp. vulgaris TaxID=3555 RepID=A0A0J8CQQ5_BETVV|nr:hypothetical protein BVRB_3g055990 [Beta vulgaris subsp. vulgaris]
MQQRRSAAGRPSGTDGSDFSFRMVVDSRYTKVAKGKSRLSIFLLIQGLVLLAGVFLILLPMVKGEDPNVLGLSSVILSFLSLVIGELGRRQSRSTLLKIYLIMSFVAMFLSVACAMKSNLLLEVIQCRVVNCWEKQRGLLVEAFHVFLEMFVKIFAATTTLSLIHNMSPPKRSS